MLAHVPISKVAGIYVLLVSSNNPKKVHAINERSPATKDITAKINFPIKRTAIAVVIKIKEKIKYVLGGIFFRNSIIKLLKISLLKRKLRFYP